MLTAYETDRLFLKMLNKDSASKVLDFYDENRFHFEPWEPKRESRFYTLSYQKASLTAEYNLAAEGKLYRYWIFTKDNPEEIIGCTCFQNFLPNPYRSCSLGYKLSYKYLHQGYATESIQKCIQIIFNEHHMHRIDAFIMPSNKPSLRLAERLDFHYEGLSLSFAKIGDTWADHLHYALINPQDL
jgi:ribosomal-protein-alanine N-acetyltransferase